MPAFEPKGELQATEEVYFISNPVVEEPVRGLQTIEQLKEREKLKFRNEIVVALQEMMEGQYGLEAIVRLLGDIPETIVTLKREYPEYADIFDLAERFKAVAVEVADLRSKAEITLGIDPVWYTYENRGSQSE